MEWGGIEIQSRKPEQHYMHFLLDRREEIRNLGELLAPLNIKYIVLLKEVDYRNYRFLYKQNDLKVVFENAMVVIFENQHNHTRVYWVRNIRKMEDWN